MYQVRVQRVPPVGRIRHYRLSLVRTSDGLIGLFMRSGISRSEAHNRAEHIRGAGVDLRRIIFYLYYDPNGEVHDYVTYKLQKLRKHAEHIFVVSNSTLTAEGRTKLESVSDTVWVRENVGFDVWAYKEAMARFGQERMVEFDELILMNYTFFGPVYPFDEVFERMDAIDQSFWGMTAHKEVVPSFEGETPFPFHIQSHWIAVRRPMFSSMEFQDYWDSMPAVNSYHDSINFHESRFTRYFADRGFGYTVAFPPENYPSDYPAFESAELMMDDRCPVLKRRIFNHDPLFLDRNAIIGRQIISKVAKTDYPLDLIWSNLAKETEPRVLYTNAGLLEIISDIPGLKPTLPVPGIRIAVLAHIFYEDMVDEMMSYVGHIPVPYDLIVTTQTEAKAAVIAKALEPYGVKKVDIRVVAENRGRDMSALFIECRDVLLSDDYDLICRIHSKKSPQDSYNAGQLFKHHMLDNVLNSTPYVERILALFQDNKTLGMVYPPIINIGYPTLGHSWFANYGPGLALAHKLGIGIPFDKTTPLSPYGSMFWARPAAIRRMAEHEFKWQDYPQEGGYSDGSLAHVQERILGYCALADGYHVRCVINSELAAINYTLLEYKLAQISSLLPYYAVDQVDFLRQAMTDRTVLATIKYAINRRNPNVGKALTPAYRVVRSGFRYTRDRVQRVRRK